MIRIINMYIYSFLLRFKAIIIKMKMKKYRNNRPKTKN